MTHKPDGYRYVRQYVTPARGPIERWALYEKQGGRARRVGTATSEREYRAFLGLEPREGEAP